VAVFTVTAFDAQGRFVPVAQNKINFAIEGAGKIIGVATATRVATIRTRLLRTCPCATSL